jgi:hypothetical protein
MSYDFIFDLSFVHGRLYKEIERIALLPLSDDGAIRGIIKKLGISELKNLQTKEVVMVVKDMIQTHRKNLLRRKDFSKTKKRALFLPHCSRKHMGRECGADFDPKTYYSCNHCTPDCLVNQATTLGHRKGYDVYVLTGGSAIRKVIEGNSYDGAVGVACGAEIKLGVDYMDRVKMPYQTVPLLKNGCFDTTFSLKYLESVL